MQKPNFIMTTLTKRLRSLLGKLCISLIVLSSCVQEQEIDIQNPDVGTRFDSELVTVKGLMKDNPERAIELLDDLIIEAAAIDNNYYAGKAKWYKAYIYDEIEGNVSEAYRCYNDALKNVLLTDDSSLKMKIYNNLGILYRFYGEYDGAIRTYESALQLKNDLGDKQLSDLYYNLGVALKLKGDEFSFSQAEQSFTKSLEFAKKADYHTNIAHVHNQIGLMYKMIKNYDMARITYNNTIETYVSNPEMRNHIGRAYHNIGVTYMDENNAEASIRAFEKALEYKRSSSSIFITKYDLGTILFRDGKKEKAIATWRDALNEKHSRNNREQVQIYADLTSALKTENQYEEALTYSEVYNSSIQNILQEGEKYKSESDRVLFASVVSEYEAFNKPVPFFSRPLVLLFSALAVIAMVFLIAYGYYRSRSKREISDVVSDIQSEFLDIKVD